MFFKAFTEDQILRLFVWAYSGILCLLGINMLFGGALVANYAEILNAVNLMSLYLVLFLVFNFDKLLAKFIVNLLFLGRENSEIKERETISWERFLHTLSPVIIIVLVILTKWIIDIFVVDYNGFSLIVLGITFIQLYLDKKIRTSTK